MCNFQGTLRFRGVFLGGNSMTMYQCVLISGFELLQRMVQWRSSVLDTNMNEVMKETISHGVPSVLILSNGGTLGISAKQLSLELFLITPWHDMLQ